MAIAYLYGKKRSGTLAAHLVQLSIEDFAIDCIAEIFERDGKNRFKRLIDYYGNYDIQEKDEVELEGISRRLVFSEVSNRIFKSYGEADPNLRKLIRNLKDVEPSSRASVTKMNDNWWVCFGESGASATCLPLIPPELLEAHVIPLLSADRGLRNLLDCLSDEFVDQTVYRRAYPVVGFAQVLLSAFSRLDDTGSSDLRDVSSLLPDEIRRLLVDSISAVRSAKHPLYVGKNKVDQDTYDAYFDVIASSLEAEFVSGDGDIGSLFDRLGEECKGLTRNSYQKSHRVFIEYLLRETRKVFLKKVKKEL